MKKTSDLYGRNLRAAKRTWGPRLENFVVKTLKCLSEDLRVEIASGDLLLLNNHWYVTHTGLLRVARRKRCSGINVEAVAALCDPAAGRYVCKATVYSSKNCSGFAGFGDADPFNVSPLVRGAEMRVAETRAVNRACARPMASASARSRKSGPSPSRRNPPESRRSSRHNLPMAMETTAARRFATAFAS